MSFTRTSGVRIGLLLAVPLFAAASVASAKPKIEIAITQAKEVPPAKKGAPPSLAPAKTAAPGETLHYIITYSNTGDEVATDAVVEDPVPKGTTYIGNTATGEGADITFSADGGKTFAQPVKLTYEMKLPDGRSEKRVATPNEYTHIRWTLKRVPPGASGKLGFQVKVN